MTSTRIALFTALAVGVLLIYFCGKPARSAPAEHLPQGANEYSTHCANCHGMKLEGGMHAPPLVGAQFDDDWRGRSARLLYSRIISTMPQNDPGSLSPQQVLAITLYVFELNGIKWTGHSFSSPNDLNALTVPAAK